MKYRKRPLFRITSACLLVLLAGLALTPQFQARAKTGPFLAGGKEPVDTATPQTTPRHDASPHSKHAPLPDAEAHDDAAPVAQPESTDQQPGFDEETSFAIGEPAVNPSYAAQASAARFAAMDGGGSGGPGGNGKHKRAAKQAEANPEKQLDPDGETDASAPQGSKNGEDKDHRDTTDLPANLPVASVPEPSSIALLAIGLLGLALARHLFS